MADTCALCESREETGDEQRLLPDSTSSMPTQLKGGRTATALKCMDCGELWTLLDKIGEPRVRILAKGEVRL